MLEVLSLPRVIPFRISNFLSLFSPYTDEGFEEKIRDHVGRLVDGEGHQFAQMLWGIRQHEIFNVVQLRTSDHVDVAIQCHVNTGAGNDHFLNPPFAHHHGQIVSDHPPIARANHVQLLHLQFIQKLPQ
ncbi:unnamed protein product [Sphenostylis stenocarpa]|uniref:Uncharacterized protein n=1 Tax=Sphenostylis stenocarpa TaxID=92480 RepID=A0AA86TND2_9FABA|nr:unnamed protein product [Sphenostylis stenocarpa]